jgi:hypothetical protein
VSDLPTGDDCIPVAELARIAGCTAENIYLKARQGRLKLQPGHRGVLMAEAKAWLEAREARKTARADAVRRFKASLGKEAT